MVARFLRKNTKSAEHSFFCNLAEVSYTYDKFHYHKEYELSYIIKNKGTRFVGDSIATYQDDDLVLIGPNLPHYWHSDEEYYQNNPTLLAKVVVIQFEGDFAGKGFFDLPELKKVKTLLNLACRGVRIKEHFALEIKNRIIRLLEQNDADQIIGLLHILSEMSCSEYDLLASEDFSQSLFKSNNEERISKIYDFMVHNFHRNLSSSEIAIHSNMTPSAFCRYFKRATKKTVLDSLNEIRVGIACKKLIETSLSISQIGYECGYQNIPYFNQQFKKIKKLKPREYRVLYGKD